MANAKLVLLKLQDAREAHVTFLKIICAAGFRHYEGQLRLETACPRPGCGRIDSFEHLLQCTGIGPVPTEVEELVQDLARLATTACPGNPGLHTHFAQQELPMDIPSEMSTGARETTKSLSFD